MPDSFEVLIPIAFFMAVYLIIKVILDHRTRQKLIEKGLVDENIKYLFTERIDTQFLNSLKWGMVLIGLGLAVFLGQFVESEKSDEITAGAMFVFAGLALMIHYGIASRLRKSNPPPNGQ